MFWDNAQQKWSTKGVQTIKFDSQTGVITCTTEHLTAFSVFTIPATTAPTAPTPTPKPFPSGATLSFGTALAVVVCTFAAVLF